MTAIHNRIRHLCHQASREAEHDKQRQAQQQQPPRQGHEQQPQQQAPQATKLHGTAARRVTVSEWLSACLPATAVLLHAVYLPSCPYSTDVCALTTILRLCRVAAQGAAIVGSVRRVSALPRSAQRPAAKPPAKERRSDSGASVADDTRWTARTRFPG